MQLWLVIGISAACVILVAAVAVAFASISMRRMLEAWKTQLGSSLRNDLIQGIADETRRQQKASQGGPQPGSVQDKGSAERAADRAIEQAIATKIDALMGLISRIEASAKGATEEQAKLTQEQVNLSKAYRKQVDRNHSWLATPYPGSFRFNAPKKPPQWTAQVGLTFAEGVSITLLCEREGCDRSCDGEPYILNKAHIGLSERACDFFLDTGVVVVSVVLSHHLAPLLLVVHFKDMTKLLEATVNVNGIVKEAVGELVSEEMKAYAYYLAHKSIKKLTGQLTDEQQAKLDKLWREDLRAIYKGGTEHLHLGMMIEEIDRKILHERRPYGGLVRVLNEEELGYEWICSACWLKRNRIQPPSSPTSP
jgi:hypothetical protein